MTRTLPLLAALLLAAPLALAHVPPAPVPTCYGNTNAHEYGPPATGVAVSAQDGNVMDCGPAHILVGPLAAHPECDIYDLPPPLCGAYDTGVNGPLLDYDGEPEYGVGGALLFVDDGDGYTYGTIACHGGTGHHGSTFAALDVAGFGPAFTITADYARPGLEDSPDCGDDYVEVCRPPPTYPFPIDVVLDTLAPILYQVFGPSANCNPLDRAHRFPAVVFGASGGSVPFGPGADGAYFAFVEPEGAFVPTAGHVIS